MGKGNNGTYMVVNNYMRENVKYLCKYLFL